MSISKSSKNNKFKSLIAQDLMYVDSPDSNESFYVHDNGDLEVEEEDVRGNLSEMLGSIPGSDGEYEPGSLIVEDEEVEVEDDPWKWTVINFLDWLRDKLSSIPSHTGKETSGCERAIAYLEKLDSEISKAVRMDLDNNIVIDAVELARDEIQDGIKRLEEHLTKIRDNKYPHRKKRKKSEAADGMVKKAKAASFVVCVPMFESYVARTCINSMVSSGKDIEDTFDHMCDKYELTGREQASIMQLLSDMGYAMRWDRGKGREEVDTASTDNFDFVANYPG
jgi:hypothetical protein